MRASFYEGARTFRTGVAPMPVPKAGEALLRVRRVGICGTDLHISTPAPHGRRPSVWPRPAPSPSGLS
jgi:threonine dehydrogenase-like Zn-dependent dehydrogenase